MSQNSGSQFIALGSSSIPASTDNLSNLSKALEEFHIKLFKWLIESYDELSMDSPSSEASPVSDFDKKIQQLKL